MRLIRTFAVFPIRAFGHAFNADILILFEELPECLMLSNISTAHSWLFRVC